MRLVTAGTAAFAAGAVLFVVLAGPAFAGDRSVTILEGVDEPPPAAAPPPPGASPLAEITSDNPAGLKIDIRPNQHLPVGTHVAFAVSTQRPGYLVMVDISSEGQLTQIYPNVMSLSHPVASGPAANLLKPGPATLIPNVSNPLARFVFQADLPRGTGAIVAILSDRPLQLIDLPELASIAEGMQAMVAELSASVRNLKIASAGSSGAFQPGVWSFAAVPYSVE